MFGFILTAAVTIMHIYVTWRACTVPFLRRHLSLPAIIGIGAALWILFYLGREFGHGEDGRLAVILEFLGMNWMGAILLITLCLLVVDIVTAFGFLISSMAPQMRGFALAAGAILAMIALFQGMRPPVVAEHEVYLAGLPEELDGTTVMAMSDMHVGSLIGRDWLRSRIEQVLEQEPDLVLLLGDIFEGRGQSSRELVPEFQRLSAPLGVWAVSGNHDFFRRGDENSSRVEGAGFRILRNNWVEIQPGLILSGVNDMRGRSRNGKENDPVSRALAGRPPGATVFLSHRPLVPEKVKETGVELLLSGHTHGGQIWPFDYLVRQEHPLLEGRYEIGETTVIVCRGTGTWGPRMRLWHPGEILKLTFRRKK